VARSFLYGFAVFLGLHAMRHTAAAADGIGPISISADASGHYEVSVPSLSWRFSGETGTPLTNIVSGSGADSMGAYTQVAFDFNDGTPRHAFMRSYNDRSSVLFSATTPATSSNTLSFPKLNQFPRNLNFVTFSGIFAPPSFNNLAADSPWVFFDSSSFHSFIVSPASNFMTATTKWGPQSSIASGIASEITSLPAGFEQRTLLVVETGINRVFDAWGRSLTALGGKVRPASDVDVSLNKVGYWTDNGAPYYYQTAGSMNYEQTLIAVKSEFDRAGIGLGYVQLDSWFYPKGPGALWSNNGQGIYEYVAAAPPFMQGLANFQQRLGVPLITHSRWIDPSSPYRKTYKMSGNVVIDPAYWDMVAAYLANSGVTTYEQDWLADNAHTDFNLTDGDAFLDNMAASMSRRNLTMQYCMASPRHFLQSSKYSNLTSIRTSADRLQRDRWIDFLYTSRLASALGVWPFTDNFKSTETTHMLLATLSAGPVGVGDPLGGLSAPNLLRSVRRDGVIVKPDVPLTPADFSYRSMTNNVDEPQINSTYSDFGGLRTYYIFGYTKGSNANTSFRLADLGADGSFYVYDYFARRGQIVESTNAIARQISGEALYLVAAPFGPSGIAIVGDTDQFVTMGKKRVSAMQDDGAVHLTISFAPGESAQTITGYSQVAPVARATAGALGPMTYDRTTHLFSIVVSPGANRSATLVLRKQAMVQSAPARQRPVVGGADR
jgi:hypothetical protein